MIAEPLPEDLGEGARRRPRRCVATRQSDERAGMVRFVLGPDRAIVPDVDERLPGRGLWLSARRDVVHTAVRRNAFARALRSEVRVDPDLASRTEELIAARCVQLLGLARRAGQVVAGFEKVAAALRSGGIAAVVEARDGSQDGRRKLRRLAGTTPVVDVLGRDELARALGLPDCVHAALARGRLADRLLRETRRLGGFREGADEVAPRAGASASGAEEEFCQR